MKRTSPPLCPPEENHETKQIWVHFWMLPSESSRPDVFSLGALLTEWITVVLITDLSNYRVQLPNKPPSRLEINWKHISRVYFTFLKYFIIFGKLFIGQKFFHHQKRDIWTITIPHNICFNSKKKNYTYGEFEDNNYIFQYKT